MGKTYYLTVSLAFILHFSSFGQDLNAYRVSGSFEDRPFTEVIEEIEKQIPTRFFLIEAWVEDLKVTGDFQEATLAEFMSEVLRGYDLQFVIYDPFTVVLTKDVSILQAISAPSEEAAEILVGDKEDYVLGKLIQVSGRLTNEKTNEPLAGATVAFESIDKSVTTNGNGEYSLEIPAGKYFVTFAYVGLEPQRRLIQLYSSGDLSVAMYEAPIRLQEVSIESTAEDINIASPYLGLIKLNSGIINKVPTLLGEADVVRTLLMMPGVNTVGEGATGLNVRGGNIDQNLITIDDAPIFNTSHLFGFFSTINPDAIGEIDFYKGSMPASLGGRASSVLDIKLKEGSSDQFNIRGGVGTISSRLTANGPIGDKTNYAISTRASYVNYILKQIQDIDIRNSRASFGDFSLKVSHRFTDKMKLSYTSYYSEDSFKFAEDTVYNWSTFNNTLKLNYLFNEGLVGSITAFNSHYEYSAENVTDINPFTLDYSLNQQTIKGDFSVIRDNFTLDFGAGYNYYNIMPGELMANSTESGIVPISLQDELGSEAYYYTNINYNLHPNLTINAGLRYAQYTALGPKDVYSYDETEEKSLVSLSDTTSYGKGDKIISYNGLEPRASIKWQFSPSFSFKGGYSRNYQYLYLVSNTAASTPLDIWRPVDSHVPPLISDQFSGGLFKNFKNNAYETSFEVYYKDLQNLVDYKDGADILLNPALETDLIIGTGKAYGAEVFFKKNRGDVTGWISYTYSRSLRKMVGVNDGETINNGEFFPSNWDSPHNVSLIANWDVNDWFDAGLNFVYNTGRPVTAPVSKYVVNYLDGQNLVVAEFSDRNQFRIPDYYRLDISITYTPKPQRIKKWDDSWTFSIYNVLGRKNPYSVFFRGEGGQAARAYQLAVIGVPIPAITYNFKFPKF